jgi:hypothetical protein
MGKPTLPRPPRTEETTEVVTFRVDRQLLRRIDDFADSEQRTRAGAISWLLSRVLGGHELSVIEDVVRLLWDELEKNGETEYAEFMRGHLYGAKSMLRALVGAAAKDRALFEVRQKVGKPIPHCVPRLPDGHRYGVDLDAG